MGKAKKARDLKKQQERDKRKAEKERAMKSPGKGSRYQQKQEAIRKGERPAIMAGIEESQAREPAQPQRTVDVASLFEPIVSISARNNRSKTQPDPTLFQTQAYFIAADQDTFLSVGFLRNAFEIPAVDRMESRLRVTSLIAEKTGEVENPQRYSWEKPTTLTWQISRLVGNSLTDAWGNNKAEVIVEEIVATAEEIQKGLSKWCKNHGTSQSSTQQQVEGAIYVSSYHM